MADTVTIQREMSSIEMTSSVHHLHQYHPNAKLFIKVATVNQSSPFPFSPCHASTQLDIFSFACEASFISSGVLFNSHDAEAFFFAKRKSIHGVH